jgi:DNA mismatch repair protein MutS
VTTPLRRQYLEIKRRYPHAILFFRLGDFYETFDEDAEVVARELEITLTSRPVSKGERVPLAGIPHHALDSYLAKLIAKGYKAAVCEQMEEAGKGKQIVERAVVRVVTPGTLVEENLLSPSANNYLAALVADGELAGLAWVDVSTGEFACLQASRDAVAAEIERLRPAELLLAPGASPPPGVPATLTPLEAGRAEAGRAIDALLRHYGVADVTALDLGGQRLAPVAAGLVIGYLAENQKAALGHIGRVEVAGAGAYLLLDANARRNLELFEPLRAETSERRSPTLIGVLDETRTPMGARLLRRWLGQPLLDPAAIAARQDGVQLFYDSAARRGRVQALLARVPDLERALARVSTAAAGSPGSSTPRDLAALGRGLAVVPELRKVIDLDGTGRVEDEKSPTSAPPHPEKERNLGDTPGPPAEEVRPSALPSDQPSGQFEERAVEDVPADTCKARSPALAVDAPVGRPDRKTAEELLRALHPCAETAALIATAIADDPAAGGVIRAGFSEELDRLRATTRDARQFLADLEARERTRTGIRTLKVGYNRVFGYYLEVSKAGAASVPDDYVRKQTLVGGERYTTPELQEHEYRVLHAQELEGELEATLLRQVCTQTAAAAERILATAAGIAVIDVSAGLAEAASRYGYVRPVVDDGDAIVIRDGRHPVVERMLAEGTFVPNDVTLSSSDAQIIMLTGPNMAGKSTYLRQAALIVLMAQAGSFVPAREARIGAVDRLFSRVGALDDIAGGHSTFMVEMLETAAMLRGSTARSLLIFDEIGRGTSTYDGMAIARAVAEFVHNRPDGHARTLFATHYHELVQLAETLPRVRNFNVAVAEEGGGVVFLHRILPGGADRSYGVHVGQLAGLPRAVVARAQELLAELETHPGHTSVARAESLPQLPLFGQAEEELRRELAALDPNALTPLEALQRLYELSERARRGD